MEIYLIRHTTPAIEKGICYGQTDLDVSETFEVECIDILSNVSPIENCIVYSSPLKRCTKLAAIFSKEVILDNRLMEINFGDWELQKWDDIPNKALQPWMDDFVNVTIPNGESYTELYKRSNHFFDEVINISAKKIIIVCHSGVIRSILTQLKGIELQNSFDIQITYGQVFKIIKANNKFNIL